jgi:PAS domain S-box-containing protein
MRKGNKTKKQPLNEPAAPRNETACSRTPEPGGSNEEEERSRILKAVSIANDGIVITDNKDRFIYSNASHARIYGYPQDELTGKTWRDVTTAETIPLVEEELSRTLHNRHVGIWRGEIPALRKDLTMIHTEVTATAQWDEKDNYLGHICIVRDITGRKQSEDKLRLFFTAVEEAPDGVQITDLNGKIIYSNKAVQKIYGFSPEEYCGRHVSEMNVDSEFAGKVILPAISETGGWAGELMVKHKGGSAFPVKLTASLIKGSKGEPIAMVGIIRDITERRRSEEMLRELNARLQTLIREIPDMVFFTDTKGQYLLANKATEEFMGLRQEELIGRTNLNVMPPDLFAACRKSDLEVLKSLKPVHVEEHYLGGGREKYFDTIKAPIFDIIDNVIGIVTICRDITDRKRTEEEREKLILELQDALAHVKTLKGLLPICAWCKKIRDDKGYWTKVETYIKQHSDASFTHGICPECLKKMDPETYGKVFKNDSEDKEKGSSLS